MSGALENFAVASPHAGIIASMKSTAPLYLACCAALAAAPVRAHTPVLACVADGQRIVVDRNAASGRPLRYRAWDVRQAADTPPKVAFGAGSREVNGTGPCRNVHYRFASGNVAYVVATPVGCTEDEPPANAIAQLQVFDGDVLRTKAWCVR